MAHAMVHTDRECADVIADEGTEVTSDQETDLLADGDDDLNAVVAGDDPDVYGAMDSGDELEMDDIEDGEDGDILPETLDADDLDDPAASPAVVEHELMFAAQCLERLGGAHEVLAGNLRADVLRDMSSTGWGDVDAPDTHDYMQMPYVPASNNGSYPGLRQEVACALFFPNKATVS
jgi:hypothetical protein